MFYLKYRPKTIKEIDNNQVKEMIGKILESKSLPHAFLFVGQKGTGKTSTARIIAKAVNCLTTKSLLTAPTPLIALNLMSLVIFASIAKVFLLLLLLMWLKWMLLQIEELKK